MRRSVRSHAVVVVPAIGSITCHGNNLGRLFYNGHFDILFGVVVDWGFDCDGAWVLGS
jgi:hypothetical protein